MFKEKSKAEQKTQPLLVSVEAMTLYSVLISCRNVGEKKKLQIYTCQ